MEANTPTNGNDLNLATNTANTSSRYRIFGIAKNHKFYLVLALAAILIVAGAIFYYQKVVLKEQISEFELSPKFADAAGIAPNASFVLKSTADLSSAVIKKHLQFEPQVDYEVKKISSGSSVFEITPAAALEGNKIYAIRISEGAIAGRTYSWAYQVKAPFQIISSIPRDKSAGVPLNTGIEITFNRENILQPEQSFEISPSVPGRFEIHGKVLTFVPLQELEPKTLYAVKIKAGIKTQGSEDTLDEEKIIKFETGEKYDYQPRPYFSFNKTFWEFKPDSEAAFTVHFANIEGKTVPVAVYRFNSMQNFISSYKGALNEEEIWSRYHGYNPAVPPQENKVFEAKIPLEEQTRTQFIRLPQKLKAGFYLADVAVNGDHKQAWFQVTPIAGFSAISGSKTVIWLKDLSNGSNIQNADITFEKNAMGKTNSDGVAMFDTPRELISKPDYLSYNYYYSPLSYFFAASVAGKSLIIPVENEYGYFSKISPPDSWWNYFSIDRGIYLPTDKIHFWGIVKQRNGTDVKGEEVLIQLTNPFWAGTSNDDITVYGETKSQISDFYTLTGEISFSDLKPGLYQLSVKRGDEIIVSENVNVETYLKPAYKLTLSADKNAIFAGDNVGFKAKAEFFDGTPVANMKLKYSGYLNGQISGEFQLNQEGEGSFAINTEYREGKYTYWPRYLGMNISPAVSEEGEIDASLSVLVFGPRLDLRIEQSFTDKISKFELRINKIVLEKIQRGDPWWDSKNYLGDPVPGWSVSAEVSEIIYKRTQTGREYNVINKVTFPVYSYSTEYRKIKEDNLVTDGTGKAYYEWTPEEKKSYRITFTTKDAQGRLIKQERYAYGGSYSYFGFYDTRGVALKNLDENKFGYKLGEQIHLQMQDSAGSALAAGSGKFVFVRVNNGISSYHTSDSPDYGDLFKESFIPNASIIGVWFSGSRFMNSYPVNVSFDSDERRLNVEVRKDKDRYRPKDKVNLNIRVTDKNGLPKPAQVNISGIDEAVFSLNPEEKDVTTALYQDIFSQVAIRSSHYSPLLEGGGGAERGGCFVGGTKIFTPDGEVEIEKLRIGDEVLTFNGVRSGEMARARIKKVSAHLVSGYLAINNKLKITLNHRLLINQEWKEAGEIKIGDTLTLRNGTQEEVISLKFVPEWKIVHNIELESYHTYFADGIFVHNEEKGGGSDRSDFRDIAIFKTVQTDSSGRAEVSFDVPDNLTSWRLTAQALSKDWFAGKSVSFVPVGLPFFVETSLNRTYLAGDDIMLRARVFGTTNVQVNINYTIESDTLPFKKIEKTGGKMIEIPLGALTPGKHKIRVAAKMGGYSDAVVRDLNALTSYFSQNAAEFYELTQDLSGIKGASKGHTALLITSYERGRFYHALRWLTCLCGARLDQKFAQRTAHSYLKKFFGEQTEADEMDIRNYQTPDGGMSLLPYSDDDLELSAKFANLVKDEETTVDKPSLRKYLESSLNDRKTDLSRVSAALYGLSAFGEPVLVAVQNIKSDRNLNLTDKIYLALALDNLGAKEEARKFYASEIKPTLTIQRPYVFINKLKNQDDNVIATAMLAGLASSLAEPEADGLGQYAMENYPKETLKNFEVLLYLKNALPSLKPGAVSFSYRTPAQNGSKTLNKDEVIRLELSRDELSTLKFSNITGRIGLVSKFEKESTPAAVKKDYSIAVSRSYSVDGRPTNEFSEGDLVRIDITPTISPNALNGAYQIVDHLPSGLRAVTNIQRTPTYPGFRYQLYPTDIEDQKITFVVWKDFPGPFFYYARVVSKGRYLAEPVLIQSLRSFDVSNVSDESRITVR